MHPPPRPIHTRYAAVGLHPAQPNVLPHRQLPVTANNKLSVPVFHWRNGAYLKSCNASKILLNNFSKTKIIYTLSNTNTLPKGAVRQLSGPFADF